MRCRRPDCYQKPRVSSFSVGSKFFQQKQQEQQQQCVVESHSNHQMETHDQG
jgi:hypothetical protein